MVAPYGSPLGDAFPMPAPPPMTADVSPDELDELAGYLADEPDLEPKYPNWVYYIDKAGKKKLRPPRKPSSKDMYAWVTADERMWDGVLQEDIRQMQLYRMTHAAAFDSEDIQFEAHFPSPEGRIQIDRLCTIINGLDIQIKKRSATKDQQKHARQLQKAAKAILERWAQDHRNGGNGDVVHEMTWHHGVLGRMAVLVEPYPDDPDFPWTIELLDPTTVFLQWGTDRYGPIRATRKTVITLGELLDAYDPGGHKGLHRKLKSKNDKSKPYENLECEGELQQVWTRWYRCAFWDGQVIEEVTDHRTGVVPILFLGKNGQAGASSIPFRRGRYTKREIEQGFGTDSSTDVRSYDMAARFGRFLGGAESTIRLEEAMLSLMITQMQLDVAPPQVTTTPFTSSPPGPVKMRPGAHTRRRQGEQTQAVQFPRQAEMGAVAGRIGQLIEKSVLPANLFGAAGGDPVGGFEENTLLAQARHVMDPYQKDVGRMLSMIVERCFYLFHGWGWQYTDNEEGTWRFPDTEPYPEPAPPLGQLVPGAPPLFPETREAYPPDAVLDRDVLDSCGFDIEVKLHTIDWREITSIANASSMLMQQGIWTKRRVAEKTGVEDPDVELDMALLDQLDADPELLKNVRGPQLWWQYDPEAFQTWMATTFMPMMMQQMGGMGGGQPTPALPEGGGGQGSVPGIQSVQGDSQGLITPDAGIPGIPRAGMDASAPGGGGAGQAYRPGTPPGQPPGGPGMVGS